MKKYAFRVYFVVVHLLIIVLVAMLGLAIHLVRADRRLPGSRLSATYTNNDDDWWHYILHDDRDPVAAVHDRYFGVDHILVAPPDSSYVWNWSREEGREWELIVSEYANANAADNHLETTGIRRLILDGSGSLPIDGYPDREVEIRDSVRTGFKLSFPDREETLSKPVVDEP